MLNHWWNWDSLQRYKHIKPDLGTNLIKRLHFLQFHDFGASVRPRARPRSSLISRPGRPDGGWIMQGIDPVSSQLRPWLCIIPTRWQTDWSYLGKHMSGLFVFLQQQRCRRCRWAAVALVQHSWSGPHCQNLLFLCARFLVFKVSFKFSIFRSTSESYTFCRW